MATPTTYGVPTNDPEDTWKASGLCRTEGEPNWWFPEGKNKSDVEAMAIAVCQRCPIRPRCRESALANRETWGVWAGLRERELRRLVGKVA